MRTIHAHTDMPRTQTPQKKATNLTLSSHVLAEAKALGINVSQACDAYLHELVHKEKEARWKLEHAEFIRAYNQVVAEESLPLDSSRTF